MADSANCARMVVVHLRREHQYESLKAIQDELSGFVMELAPDDLPANSQVRQKS